MATVSPPTTPKRDNLLWIGGIWGLAAGAFAFILTLILFAVIVTITSYTSPNADEVIGYVYIFAGIICVAAIVPALIGGAVIGVVLALIAQRRRGASNGGWLGAGIGIFLYVLTMFIVFFGTGSNAEGLRDMQPTDWLFIAIPAIPAALVFGGLSGLLHRRAARYLR